MVRQFAIDRGLEDPDLRRRGGDLDWSTTARPSGHSLSDRRSPLLVHAAIVACSSSAGAPVSTETAAVATTVAPDHGSSDDSAKHHSSDEHRSSDHDRRHQSSPAPKGSATRTTRHWGTAATRWFAMSSTSPGSRLRNAGQAPQRSGQPPDTEMATFHLDLTGMEVTGVEVDGTRRGSTGSTPNSSSPRLGLVAAGPFHVGSRLPRRPGRRRRLKPGRCSDLRRGTPMTTGRSSWESRLVRPGGSRATTIPPTRLRCDCGCGCRRHYAVASSGVLEGVERTGGGDRVFTWRTTRPLAPYMLALGIGRWVVEEHEGPVPIVNYLDPDLTDAETALFDRQPEMLEELVEFFGPYPFDSYGALVLDDEYPAGGARDPDPEHLLPGVARVRPERRGPRDGASVVRGQRDLDQLAGHLAPRGLRHLQRVAVGRGRPRPRSARFLRSVRLLRGGR